MLEDLKNQKGKRLELSEPQISEKGLHRADASISEGSNEAGCDYTSESKAGD